MTEVKNVKAKKSKSTKERKDNSLNSNLNKSEAKVDKDKQRCKTWSEENQESFWN